MDTISVADARQTDAIGRQVQLRGWVRTRRDSKGGFSFIELNDGSSQGNIQIVAPGTLPNYDADVLHLHTGSSVVVTGEIKASPAKGQATEVHAASVKLIGSADPEAYPLQKKGHTFEFLRTHRSSSATDQYLRRDGPVAASRIENDPRFLRRARLFLRPHADHHGERLRRRRGTVPRDDD